MRRLSQHQWRHFLSSISKPSPTKHIHGFSTTNPNTNQQNQTLLIDAISESLRSNENWETLSTKFSSSSSSTILSDSLVVEILLRFKNPESAKLALSFFHWSSQSRNRRRHAVSSYAVAIHILVRSRLLVDARALIESSLSNPPPSSSSSSSSLLDSLLSTYEISSSTPLVFDLLIQGYAKLRYIESGLYAFRKLTDEEHRFSLSVITLNTLLHYASKSNRIDLVWRIYELAIDKRVYPNDATFRILIGALCKEGKLKEIVDLLEKMRFRRCSPPLIVNTSLVFRVLEENRVDDGMFLLKRLLQKNMVIDTIGYSLVVYAKTKEKDLVYARKVFDEMLQRGFEGNSFVYTAFVRVYVENGDIEEAEKLMKDMESFGIEPYEETFNCLVEGCAKFGKEEKSLEYCEVMMTKGLVSSLSAFNETVKRLNEIHNLKRANGILTKSMDKGFLPNEDTYTRLINGFIKVNDIEQALKLYYEMEYRKMSPGFEVFESLIAGLCTCGRVGAGEKYLRVMKSRSIQPNEDIYEALISAFRKIGDKTNADRVYIEMISIR
ncbi:unnamed protein product [Cochlearia groenlandica]